MRERPVAAFLDVLSDVTETGGQAERGWPAVGITSDARTVGLGEVIAAVRWDARLMGAMLAFGGE